MALKLMTPCPTTKVILPPSGLFYFIFFTEWLLRQKHKYSSEDTITKVKDDKC